MQRRYVTADVFTDCAFGGNPLAVVLDAEGLSAVQMQAIAREFNYSETTFVLPPADPAHTAQVRIFTPAVEIPFAGHPNVGTALVLARRMPAPPPRLSFEESAGLVTVDMTTEKGVPVAAELTAPQPFHRGADIAVADLAAAVSLAAANVVTTMHPPTLGSVGMAFAFAEIASRAALARAQPDAALLAGLLTSLQAAGVLLYTRDGAGAGFDLQARMFFQVHGFVEDPATGSAALALAALLASLAPEPSCELTMRVGQGEDMGRPSLLLARAVKRDAAIVSAHVGGRCVEVMQGTLVL